jgi:hypothetical protein
VVERDPIVRANVPLLTDHALRRSCGDACARDGGRIACQRRSAAEIVLVAVTLGATLTYRVGADSIKFPLIFIGPMTALPSPLPRVGSLPGLARTADRRRFP